MSISSQKRKKIVEQSLKELSFARTYKQGKTENWAKNEAMYYGRKIESNTAMANVELGKMSAFVHTVLSKIDSPLTFEYQKMKQADLKKVNLLNSLRERDSQNDNWDFKDILGKKQGIIYGRAIFAYSAQSKPQYKSNLENVDIYDFHIDPAGGGWDIEKAMYLGRWGVVKSKTDLRSILKKSKSKDGYVSSEIRSLINGDGNPTEKNQEEMDKQSRTQDVNTTAERDIDNPDIYKFWEWFTTYDGERYYVLMTESGQCIRIQELGKMFKDAKYPFWTWAAFPDLTEFWTPSYCDYVREIFMAQSISINQMLDNAEKRNKPQKIVQPSQIESLSDLVYRRNGLIRVKPGVQNVGNVIQTIDVPSINTPINVYELLEKIQQAESGVTADARGIGDEDKVTIYEGNVAAAADRFGLLNKSYAQGYKRFAELYYDGAEWRLTPNTLVKILGPDGLEKSLTVSKRDIKSDIGFDVLVKSSVAESQTDATDKKNKLTFLGTYINNDQLINTRKAFEIQAEIAGFDSATIRALLDVENFGTGEIMAEADRDIERILNNEIIEPNLIANGAYRQRFVSYMTDHFEDMDSDTWLLFVDYVNRIEPIVLKNLSQTIQDELAKEGKRVSTEQLKAIDPIVGEQSQTQLESQEPQLAESS